MEEKKITFIVSCLARTLAVTVYGALGALVFMYAENADVQTKISNSTPNETHAALNKLRSKYNCILHNISDEEFKSLAQSVLSIGSIPDQPKTWTYGDGLQLVFETLTTIGYGSTPPTTEAGRVLMIFYALFGVPLFLYFLQIIGEAMNKVISRAIHLMETKCTRVKEPKSLELKTLLGFAVFVTVFILSMAAVVMKVDGLSYRDSLYALIITFTTIGYGDFILSKGNLALIIVGMCLVSGLFDAVLAYSKAWSERAMERQGKKQKICCFGKQTGVVEDKPSQEQYEAKNKNGAAEVAEEIA